MIINILLHLRLYSLKIGMTKLDNNQSTICQVVGIISLGPKAKKMSNWWRIPKWGLVIGLGSILGYTYRQHFENSKLDHMLLK